MWSSGNFSDKYVLRSIVLGKGAFSTVQLGSYSSKGEDVAVKVIERTRLCEEEENRLIHEVSVLREISSHKNILSEFIL